jgi:cytoskeletal protein RodZ
MATVHTAGPGLREDGSISVGLLLRHARERRGLTLQQIAKETKLPQRHLEALEQGNLTLLPAGFYQRAEIRAYARAVGLDQKDLLAKLDSAMKPAEARDTPRATPQPQVQEPTLTRAHTLVALGIIAVVALGYAITERMRPSEPVAVQPEQTEPVASAPTLSHDTAPRSIEPSDAVKASAVNVALSSETVEPPPPPNAVTELVVTTQPPGARVTVNGIAWGITPVTIHHLPPGAKQIRVTKEGYAAQERLLRLDQGRRQALDISLESVP